MKKVLISIVLLILVAGGGFLGLDYYARQEAIRRVDVVLQSLPNNIEASRGEVRYAFQNDTLQIDNLKLTTTLNASSVSIARLTLAKFGETAEGDFTVENLVASGIETSIENWLIADPQLGQEVAISGTGRVDSYEVEGLVVAPDYAENWATVMHALLSGQKGNITPDVINSMNRGVALDSIVTRNYQADLQLVIQQNGHAPIPVDYNFSVPESRLDNYRDGRLESLAFASFDMNAESNTLLEGVQGFNVSVSSGAGTIKGLDTANAWRLYASDDSSDMPLPLLSGFEIADLSYGVKTAAPFTDLELTLDNFSMADYRLSPSYLSQLGLLEQSSDPLLNMHNLKGLIESYYVGQLEFSGMSFRSADAAQPRFNVGHLLMEKLDGARFDKILLEEFKLTVPSEGSLDLGALELGGFDYSGLIEHLPVIVASETFPRGSLPKMDLFRISALDVDAPNGKFALGNFLMVTSDYYQSVGTTGHMEMANLTFDMRSLNDQGQIASAVTGVDVLDISLTMDHSWDVPSGIMDLSNVALTLKDLGKISFDLSITGAGESIIALMHGDDAAFTETEALKLALKSARILYEDQSLLPKIYETMAALQGLTPTQVRAGFVAQAASYAQIMQDPALIRTFDRGLRSFAADPRSLEIRLDPSEPIPLALMSALALSTPGELARALEPSIVVNQ